MIYKQESISKSQSAEYQKLISELKEASITGMPSIMFQKFDRYKKHQAKILDKKYPAKIPDEKD